MGTLSETLDGLTVLVVDDDYETIHMLVGYLRSHGASVMGIRDAKAAMRYAMTARVDAVLVDLRTRDGNGRWLLGELRKSQTPSACAPFFALGDERRGAPSCDDGFAGHFITPVELDRLVAALAVVSRQSS